MISHPFIWAKGSQRFLLLENTFQCLCCLNYCRSLYGFNRYICSYFYQIWDHSAVYRCESTNAIGYRFDWIHAAIIWLHVSSRILTSFTNMICNTIFSRAMKLAFYFSMSIFMRNLKEMLQFRMLKY